MTILGSVTNIPLKFLVFSQPEDLSISTLYFPSAGISPHQVAKSDMQYYIESRPFFWLGVSN